MGNEEKIMVLLYTMVIFIFIFSAIYFSYDIFVEEQNRHEENLMKCNNLGYEFYDGKKKVCYNIVGFDTSTGYDKKEYYRLGDDE